MSQINARRVTYLAAGTDTFATMLRAAQLLVAAIAGLAAALGVSVKVGKPASVAVLVDVSPSTRGEWFRDAAVVRREAERIARQLMPGATLRFSTFADVDAAPFEAEVVERPSMKSVLPAVDADAVLLFSDGRFESAGDGQVPTFPVVANSNSDDDARIIDAQNTNGELVVTVVNDGRPRSLTWPDGTTSAVPHGRVRLAHAASNEPGIVYLDAGDRWPENDRLTIAPSPTRASEDWWIGAAPPDGYRAIDAFALPALPAWLAARSVVINNVPASAIDAAAQQTITRYVRDLGGGLVIVGGDRSFSAGGYGGSDLDALSPLASAPPEPRNEWLVLIDASGSMADRVTDGRTRLQAAIDAASALVASLPKNESVAVASFAKTFQTWPALKDRRIVAPIDLEANGPTNLAATLKAVIAARADHPTALPVHVVVLSDGDADLNSISPEEVVRAREVGIAIDWLRLSESLQRGPLADVVTASGGTIVDAGAAAHWRAAAIEAAAAAIRIDAATMPTKVRWHGDAVASEPNVANRFNETWLRTGAEILATRDDADQASNPAAAQWRAGIGRVAAIGFAANASTVKHLADLIASRPSNSRFAVEWSAGKVTVEAIDAGVAMNGLRFRLRELGSAGGDVLLDQIAPGRYEAEIAITPRPLLMELRLDEQSIDVHATLGVTPEFSEIGLDRESLDTIARRSGGRVIERGGDAGVPIISARQSRSLAVPLLILASLALCGAVMAGSIFRRVGK